MAYATRRFIKHIDDYDRVHRLEIQQLDFAGTESSIKANKGSGAFKFEHEDVTDEDGYLKVYANPIQKGMLEVYPLIENSTDFGLLTDIFQSDEDEFRLVWEIDGSIFWTGYVLNDLLEFEESSYPYTSTIVAKDFSRLKGMDYGLDDTRQTWITTIADLLSNLDLGLDIETATSWTESHLDSSLTGDYDYLNHIYHETKALREFGRTGDETPQPISVYEALQKVLSDNCLILKQIDGKYQIDQLSAYDSPASVLVSTYDSTGTQTAQTSVDKTLTYNRNTMRVLRNGSKSKGFVAIKRAKVKFDHRNRISGLLFSDDIVLTGNDSHNESGSFISDGNQKLRLTGEVEAFAKEPPETPDNATAATAEIVVVIERSGLSNYWWDGSSWVTSFASVTVDLGNPGGNRWLASFELFTDETPADADGLLSITLHNVETDQDPTGAGNIPDETTYYDTSLEITNINNSVSTDFQLTQSAGFSEKYEHDKTWYGDGPNSFSVSAIRHSTADGDITNDSWQRRGTTTGYRDYHENVLKEIVDIQRTFVFRKEAQMWGLYDATKVLQYRSGNYYYTGGSFAGASGDWNVRIMDVGVQTGSDTFEEILKYSDGEGSAPAPPSGGGGSGDVSDHGALTGLGDPSDHPWAMQTDFSNVADWTPADGRFLNEANNLSDLRSITTAQDNLGLTDGSADLDINSLVLNSPLASLRIVGSEDGNLFAQFIQFDQATAGRAGFVGYGSEAHSDFTLRNDIGGINLSTIGEAQVNNNEIWHDGNVVGGTNISLSGQTINVSPQGAGSGLDADLWDGNQFADYLDQPVRTTDSVTFATVNTGQGNNELYPMDQPVRTTDFPTFGGLEILGTGTNSNVFIQNPSSTGDSLIIWRDSTGANDWYAGSLADSSDWIIHNYQSGNDPLTIDKGNDDITIQDRFFAGESFGTAFRLTDTVGGSNEIGLLNENGGDLRLFSYTGVGDTVRILKTGEVGIGTTTPNSLLHVAGTATFEGSVLFDSVLGTDNYIPQEQGWRGDYGGNFDFRTVFTDELIAKTFTVDVAQALAGSDVLTKSVATLAEDFVIPAVGNTGTLVVDDLPGLVDFRVFEENDWVLMKVVDISDGAQILEIWGQVTGYTDNGDDTQSWTFTTDYGGLSGAGVGRTINKSAIVLDYGKSGDTYIERTVLDRASSSDFSKVPYDRIVQWTGSDPRTGTKTVLNQRGNLNGLADYTSPEYGWVAFSGNDKLTVDPNNGIRFLDTNNVVGAKFNSSIFTIGTGSNFVEFDVSAGTGNIELDTFQLFADDLQIRSDIPFIRVGSGTSNQVGIAGISAGTDVAFWAGDGYSARTTAPVRIYGGGDFHFGGSSSNFLDSSAGVLTADFDDISFTSTTFDLNAGGGQLIIDSTVPVIEVGGSSGRAGMTGATSGTGGGDSVVFWAGDTFANRTTAEIWMKRDGSFSFAGGDFVGTPSSVSITTSDFDLTSSGISLTDISFSFGGGILNGDASTVNVAGFTADSDSLESIVSNKRILIQNGSPQQFFRIQPDTTQGGGFSFVDMFVADSGPWGLRGRVFGEGFIFQLGSTNEIAGFAFDSSQFESTNLSGGGDGSFTTDGILINSGGFISAPNFYLDSAGAGALGDLTVSGLLSVTGGNTTIGSQVYNSAEIPGANFDGIFTNSVLITERGIDLDARAPVGSQIEWHNTGAPANEDDLGANSNLVGELQVDINDTLNETNMRIRAQVVAAGWDSNINLIGTNVNVNAQTFFNDDVRVNNSDVNFNGSTLSGYVSLNGSTAGELRIPVRNDTTRAASPNPGEVIFNTDANTVQVGNNSNGWKSL